jgi:hypothetical protein
MKRRRLLGEDGARSVVDLLERDEQLGLESAQAERLEYLLGELQDRRPRTPHIHWLGWLTLASGVVTSALLVRKLGQIVERLPAPAAPASPSLQPPARP